MCGRGCIVPPIQGAELGSHVESYGAPGPFSAHGPEEAGQQVPKLCVNGQRPRRAREAQFGHFQGCILYSIPAQGLALLNAS
jgi:hypothetical protein